jgi:hypothetical protein
MGSEDNKMMEEALNDLREQNDTLRKQNKDIKFFLIHLNNELTHILKHDSMKKEI